jgi:hypothetical protein
MGDFGTAVAQAAGSTTATMPRVAGRLGRSSGVRGTARRLTCPPREAKAVSCGPTEVAL